MIISIFSLVAIFAQAQPTGVLATVNGQDIPQSLLELVVRVNVAQGQQDSPEMRKKVREDLINEELLVQEALRKKLNIDRV